QPAGWPFSGWRRGRLRLGHLWPSKSYCVLAVRAGSVFRQAEMDQHRRCTFWNCSRPVADLRQGRRWLGARERGIYLPERNTDLDWFKYQRWLAFWGRHRIRVQTQLDRQARIRLSQARQLDRAHSPCRVATRCPDDQNGHELQVRKRQFG